MTSRMRAWAWARAAARGCLLMCIAFDVLRQHQAHALEEPSPEVFLPPRNFNPHPYELGYDPSGDRRVSRLREYANHIDVFTVDRNRGPVLFPPTTAASSTNGGFYHHQDVDVDADAGDGDVDVDNRITTDPYIVAKLKDTHPYAGVAAKKKYAAIGLGRFASEPEQHSPQVYKALAAHGAKVLKVPQAKDLKNVPNLEENYDYDDGTKKNYAFSYKVVDHLTGDDFSHSQSQDSHATNGEYRVKLPDGRVQIVSYTADKNGYKADVKYASNKHTDTHHNSPEPTAAVHDVRQQHVYPPSPPLPPPTHQHLRPVSALHPAPPPSSPSPYYDNLLHAATAGDDDDGGQQQEQEQAQRDDEITLKSHAHDFINQHLITGGPTKAPYYAEAVLDSNHHHHHHHQQHQQHQQQQQQYDPNVLLILANKYRDAAIRVHSGGESANVHQLLHNIRGQKAHEHGKFIAATLAPYIVAQPSASPHRDHYHHHYETPPPALSTFAPDLDKFNPVYIDAPKYKLSRTIHH